MDASGWLTTFGAALAALGAGVGFAGRSRAVALRRVLVDPPGPALLEAARAAGQRLVGSGPVGLVLAGGGAKGAYQVGCWKALRACGIDRFEAVAGTSVGALNAVLVAQDDWGKAEAIWHDMHFGRVLRLHWTGVLAVLIRILLFVPLLGRLAFPARAIPAGLWRAVRGYRDGMRAGDPRAALQAALQLYASFLDSPTGSENVFSLILGVASLTGLSAAWYLALPLVEIVAVVLVAPFVVLLLVTYAAWFTSFLDQLSTRLVLASNEPLHDLLVDCVDIQRLKAARGPLYVTLASLREVVRQPPLPTSGAFAHARSFTELVDPQEGAVEPIVPDFGSAAQDEPWRLPTTVATVEYVPSHFEVRSADPAKVHELILQSAGLPEIFPARRIDGDLFVDGGMVDNVPVSALVGVPGLATLVVIPLDRSLDEAAVRESLAANLERLGRPALAAKAELVVLTPSRDLGSFLTGTLDFSAQRSRALMALGFADTVRALAARR